MLFSGNEVVQNFFVGCDFVNHQLLPENQSSNVPAVKTADSQIVIDLSHVMCRDFSISPFVCRKRRDCLALQPGLLPNDQAVKVCQKQRMFLALVNGVCTSYFQTGGLGEALRHIILQITALPHSLVVDIFSGIADFIVVHLKCRAVGIQAKDSPGIRAGNAALTVTEPILFGQVPCRYKPFHALCILSLIIDSVMIKSYSTKSFMIVEKSAANEWQEPTHRS